MADTKLGTAEEQAALVYCRGARSELAQFGAYFQGTLRYDAVDSAVLNIVRMRIEILSEQIDHAELAELREEIIDEMRRTNSLCCDFLILWDPGVPHFA